MSAGEEPGVCGVCGVCGGAGAGLARRDLAPLCAAARQLYMPDSAHYTWICQFCWRRANQCIKFIERVRNSEQLLHNTLADAQNSCQKSIFYNLEVVSVGKISICKSKRCLKDSSYSTIIKEELNNLEIADSDKLKDEPNTCELIQNSVKIEADPASETDDILVDVTYDVEINDESQKLNAEEDLNKESENELNCSSVRTKELLMKYRNKCVQLEYTIDEQLKEVELRKRSNRYRYSKYKCEMCGRSTNEIDMHEKHLRKHDKSAGKYECEVCKYRFSGSKSFSRHMTAHRQRWRCAKCSAVLPDLTRCLLHYEICSDSAPTCKCDVCGKIFQSPHALAVHKRRIHILQKRFTCDECNKSYKNKCELRKHLLAHAGWTRFECDVCGKKYMDLHILKKHMKAKHDPPTERTEDTYCVECDVYFKTKLLLRQHLTKSLKHVTRDTYRHVCGQCSERFSIASLLELHIRTVHTGERTHRCTLCDKAYFTSGAVRSHMKNKHSDHERPRNHVCAVCGKAFYSKTTLKGHMVGVHNKERPFACELCPATFGYSAALFTHNKLKHGKRKMQDQ